MKDYGIVAGAEVEPGVIRCDHLVEKPSLPDAPSHLAITGAYLLTPEIYSAIERTPPGVKGEIQLTDALQLLAREGYVYASTFVGKRFDIGDRFLWIKANVEFAMNRSDLRERLEPVLRDLLGHQH